jgi:phospholipase C
MFGARLAVAVILAMGASGAWAAAPGFKHVIIVVQENRTPDNLFGSNTRFEKGVDLARSGVTSTGQTVPLTPRPLADCYDINHAHVSFEMMLQAGADKEGTVPQPGCVLPANPEFVYVDNSTGGVQPYFDMATNYGFANRMFQTSQGASFPSHLFIFSGTSAPSTESSLFASSNVVSGGHTVGCTAPADKLVDLIDGYGSDRTNPATVGCYEHPALTDLLDAAGLSWRYYSASPTSIWTAPNAINHICLPAFVGATLQCTGPDWQNGSVQATNPAQVLTDISKCALAAVSWVTPTGEESDHSPENNGSGPSWVAAVVNAVGQQPACAGTGETYWNDTAIFVTWDDWGGYYDHVAPLAVNVQPTTPPQWGDGYTYGFRVPLLVISAYTAANTVDDKPHDFGTLLEFIERNFGLGYIGPGDTIYSQYADYQAAARHDTLAGFFTLATPKPFVPIAAPISAREILRRPVSMLPLDDDGYEE